MTTFIAPAPIRVIPDVALVLGKRKLRAGLKLADTSRFGDDVWVLTPAIHQRHVGLVTLDFRTLPIRFRLVAKELFYLLLTGDLPPECASMRDITTIQKYFYFARSFLRWVDQRQAAALSTLTTADFEEFEQRLASQRISKEFRQQKWRAARLFWLCRAKLTTDRLTFDPAALLTEDGQAGGSRSRRGSENTTDRIPEPVHAPLLVWALRWVDDFADDVLRACSEWSVLFARGKASRTRRSQPVNREIPERLTALLAQYRADGRPLPGQHGAVNLSHLAREVDCSRKTLCQPRYVQIQQAAEDLGIDDGIYLWTEVRGRLEGQPWLEKIPYGGVELLARLLQTACYIVVAYLSGMRDSEVKHLQRGCLTV